MTGVSLLFGNNYSEPQALQGALGGEHEKPKDEEDGPFGLGKQFKELTPMSIVNNQVKVQEQSCLLLY